MLRDDEGEDESATREELERMYVQLSEGYDDAMRMFDEAADMYCGPDLEREPQRMVRAANHLNRAAHAMYFKGEYEAAVRYMERAVTMLEQNCGAEDPSTLESRLSLARFRQSCRKERPPSTADDDGAAQAAPAPYQMTDAASIDAQRVIYEDLRRRLGLDNKTTTSEAAKYMFVLHLANDNIAAATVGFEKLQSDIRTSRNERGETIARIPLVGKLSRYLRGVRMELAPVLCALFESGDFVNGRRFYEAVLEAAEGSMRHRGPIAELNHDDVYYKCQNNCQFHMFAVQFALFGAMSPEHAEQRCLDCNRETEHINPDFMPMVGDNLRSVTSGVLAIALFRQRRASPHKLAEAIAAFRSVSAHFRPEAFNANASDMPESLMWFSTPEYGALRDAALAAAV